MQAHRQPDAVFFILAPLLPAPHCIRLIASSQEAQPEVGHQHMRHSGFVSTVVGCGLTNEKIPQVSIAIEHVKADHHALYGESIVHDALPLGPRK